MTKQELLDNCLDNVCGGKNISEVIEYLIPLMNDYPEIYDIVNAYEQNDYGLLLQLIQKFCIDHPDLSYLFEE